LGAWVRGIGEGLPGVVRWELGRLGKVVG
jgi:hypothetical protein